MVPHSLSYANPISDEKLKSADILSRDRQFLGKRARISRRPQHQRFLTCAISTCAYNNVCITFERTSYSAAGTVNPDGYHARDCGTIQPEQLKQEPRLNYSFQVEIPIQQPFKCKQPPRPDGCLTRHTQPTPPFYASQVQVI